MKPRLALPVLFACLLFPLSCALAQSPRDPEVMRLQREIAQARAMIAKWTETLHSLEQQLARAEAAPPGLRFPYDVERAMIGQGLRASQQLQLRPQSTAPAGQSRGGFIPPR